MAPGHADTEGSLAEVQAAGHLVKEWRELPATAAGSLPSEQQDPLLPRGLAPVRLNGRDERAGDRLVVEGGVGTLPPWGPRPSATSRDTSCPRETVRDARASSYTGPRL